MTYDREATRLFGLTVSFVSPDKRWCVTGNGVGEMVCGDYAAAVDAREAIVNRYLAKMDQMTIDGFLRSDRIANIRGEIIDVTGDGIECHEGHSRDLYVFESGGFWGEAYDDELLALERLLESAKAAPVNLLNALNQFRKEAASVPLSLETTTAFICALVASSTSLDAVGERVPDIAAE